MTRDTSSPQQRRNKDYRFLPFILFIFLTICLFTGGISAFLYWLFSEYSGVRNIWLLLCGAPFVLVAFIIFVVGTLYTRFGKPLEQLFNTINAVEEGDLSVRVPESQSDLFSNLFKRFNKMVGELERSTQQRRNLTADIAHELRTPLHIIQGNLEGVLDGIYEPTPEHIKDTLDESRLLSRLVNDLQTLSLAETGQLPLHPTRFLLADLIADLTSSFASPVTSQSISLQTNITNPNQYITADYDRLNQVLSNLISNALRHTPEGGKISINAETYQTEERSLRITVEDTGAGISPEDLPFIFDRFWRADKSRSERTHIGLGLAITKQLVLAHGGTIEALSVVGEGTTFVIELPDEPEEDKGQ